MITGRLQEKNNRYYAVLNVKNEQGKWKPKWISTGLTVKGNKKRAEAKMRELIAEYEKKEAQRLLPGESDGILFSEFMLNWLKLIRSSVEETTFTAYQYIVQDSVAPYFEQEGVTLADLKPKHIQAYYTYLLTERKVSASTVKRHHANIRKALQHAVKTDLILTNPADKVEKPKQQPFIASHYDADELNALFQAVSGTRLELPVLVAAYYGLRRSEVIGLKWSAIDFKENTVCIRHTVSQVKDEEGNNILLKKDRTKNKSSHRTLPLLPHIKDKLLEAREKQKMYRKVCGKEYSLDHKEYVFVDELGKLLNPNYITQAFPALLEKNGLRRIRFHDLRHSCASLMLNSGVSMKQIQEWLGHSNFSTTANTYAHLDHNSKKFAAEAIEAALSAALPVDTAEETA